jgi:phenylpropionate dioxygenase-like ring-hydroxylating dioxygenase large terminal subunit
MIESTVQLRVSRDLIPPYRYTSREFMELEMERLWPRVWQLACREQDVRRVGQYYEYVIGDQSILLVRTDPDRIRGFVNACLHRGTRLKSGCGQLRETIRCRYHGWAWGLDGTIKDVPDVHEFAPECVADEALQLPEVQVDTWGGFVFINMDPAAESLKSFLGPLPELFDKYEPEKMSYSSYRSAVLPCNWKTAVDAFIEVYHLEGTHVHDLGGMASGSEDVVAASKWERGENNSTVASYGFGLANFERHNWIEATSMRDRPLSELGPDRKGALIKLVDGLCDSGLANPRELHYIKDTVTEVPADENVYAYLGRLRREMGQRDGLDLSHYSDADLRAGSLVLHCFPNWTCPSGALNWDVQRFRPNGLDPESCIYDRIFLHRFPDGEEPEVEKQWIDDWAEYGRNWGPLVLQDLANLPHIQAGMHQRTFKGLRLSSMENNIRNLHRVIDEYLERD